MNIIGYKLNNHEDLIKMLEKQNIKYFGRFSLDAPLQTFVFSYNSYYNGRKALANLEGMSIDSYKYRVEINFSTNELYVIFSDRQYRLFCSFEGFTSRNESFWGRLKEKRNPPYLDGGRVYIPANTRKTSFELEKLLNNYHLLGDLIIDTLKDQLEDDVTFIFSKSLETYSWTCPSFENVSWVNNSYVRHEF
jgi:hypothetical protein